MLNRVGVVKLIQFEVKTIDLKFVYKGIFNQLFLAGLTGGDKSK